jgi:hypothetical protein
MRSYIGKKLFRPLLSRVFILVLIVAQLVATKTNWHLYIERKRSLLPVPYPTVAAFTISTYTCPKRITKGFKFCRHMARMKWDKYNTGTGSYATENDALLPGTARSSQHNSNDESIDDSLVQTNFTSGQKILDLAIPAAGALLIDPLMTLIDTAFVGRFTIPTEVGGNAISTIAAAPLAGMGSAASLLTFAFYLFNFLCTTTSPLVALKRSSGNEKDAITLGGQVLSLSFILGCTLTTMLFFARQPLLLIMGTGNTGADANAYSMNFLAIRAFAAPAVLCMEASTGVLRGFLDTKTPFMF